MRRRTYLALAGSSLAASVAGCLQETGSAEQPLLETEREPRQFQIDAQNTGVAGASAPANPERRWKTTIEPISGGLAVINDRLVIAADEQVYALDTDDGTVLWTSAVANGLGPPAVTDDTAYIFATSRGLRQGLHAIDLEDGTRRWKAMSSTGATTAPTLAEDAVYVSRLDTNREVLAIDATDGSERWRFEAGEWVSTPAVRDGLVYVGGGQSETVYALDSDTGEPVWSTETAGIVRDAPTVVDGTVYVPSKHGRLYALAADNGREQWTADLSVIADESIPADAEPVTRIPYRSDWIVPTSVAATSETVYATINTAIIALDSDGEHLWSQPGGSEHPPVRAGDSLLVSSENAVCLDPENGEKLWEFPVERRVFTDTTADGVGCHPVVTDDTMFVGANGGYVYALE